MSLSSRGHLLGRGSMVLRALSSRPGCGAKTLLAVVVPMVVALQVVQHPEGLQVLLRSLLARLVARLPRGVGGAVVAVCRLHRAEVDHREHVLVESVGVWSSGICGACGACVSSPDAGGVAVVEAAGGVEEEGGERPGSGCGTK